MKSRRKVLFLDERSHYDFIDRLFLELGRYYDGYVRTTNDIPYAYSERTFVGHLAQAASRNNYYSIQDYDVTGKDIKKHLKSHYVPDLHIWMPRNNGEPATCVFEAKTTYPTPIDKDTEVHSQSLLDLLLEADKQMDDQGMIEAEYRCSLVASAIYCASTKWAKYASTPKAYKLIVNQIIENVTERLKKSHANFVWAYMLDYETIETLIEKRNGKIYLPWIGILCSGKVQLYRNKQ